MPFFVREGKNIRNPIASLPGISQLSIDNLIKEAKAAKSLGLPLFCYLVFRTKRMNGLGAFAKDG